MGKREKKRAQLNNGGFTLVEVLVSLAIMAIVAATISAFVIAGNRTYVRGNNAVNVQEEAQLAVNQMIDLIIDVEKDIDYKVGADGSAQLRLYNNDATYMLRWIGSDASGVVNQILFYEETGTVTGEAFDPVESYTGYLLAEHVTAFQVDLSKLKKSIVILSVSFQYGDDTYQVSETIKLRNRLNVMEESSLTWIEDISIVPDTHTMKRGTSYDFDCVMTGDEVAITQGVIWKVERVDGNSIQSGTQVDANGKLMVASGEEIGAGVLLLTATSIADPTKSATATVTVEKEAEAFDPYSVNLIVRTLTTEETGSVWNKKQQYVAVIECLPDYADYVNGYPKITWTETTNPSSYNLTEQTQFTVKLECGTMQDTIAHVNATVEISAGVFVDAGIDIYIPKLEAANSGNKPYIDSDNFVLDRNSSVSLTLKNYNKPGTVTWRIADTQGLGSTDPNARMVGFDLLDGSFDSENNTRNYTDTHTGRDATVRAKAFIDFDTEYRLNIQAVEDDGDVIAETTVLIPRFEILFSGGEHYKTISKPVWYRQYYLEVYGFVTGQSDSAGGNNRLQLNGNLQADKDLKEGTRIANMTFDGTGDYVAMDVAWDEENDYIVLILWDERRPKAKRSLIFLVE